MDELAHLDATAQAQLVRRKDVAPTELVEAAIRRIEEANPALNAVVTRLYDAAREAARRPLTGPFAGVPFLVKDLLVKIAGTRGTAGSCALADNVDAADSELGRRYRAAGLITLGKTSTPELGLLPTSEPALFGPAKNPWDRSRSTGGSSGGSAAAVARRLVPMAHGNDGGGSIRLPASCCGVFGFKPTRGRVPLGPDYNDPFLLVSEHAITISVRDSAALLDATCGPMAGEPAGLPRPAMSFAEALKEKGPRLRIAFTAKAPAGTPVHTEAVMAVTEAAKLCAALGHHVEEAAPDIDGKRFYDAFVEIWIDSCAATIETLIGALGRDRALAGIEPFTRQLWERGLARRAVDHLRAREFLARVARRMAAFLEGYDIWLTPTTGHPPPPIGYFGHLTDTADEVFARSAAFVPWTPLANTAGLPAMSVPLHWTADGLPMGAHFMGRSREEATLFRLAAELELARPWIDRVPPL